MTTNEIIKAMESLSIEDLTRIKDEARVKARNKVNETYFIIKFSNYKGNITEILRNDDDLIPCLECGAVKLAYESSDLGIGTNKVFIRKDINEFLDGEFDVMEFLKEYIPKTYDSFYTKN